MAPARVQEPESPNAAKPIRTDMPKLKFPRGHPIGSQTGLGKIKIPTIYDTHICSV